MIFTRILFLVFCSVILLTNAYTQKTFKAENGKISFISSRNSDVSAVNDKVTVTLNLSGNINFNLLIRDFKFEMVEMEDHFNDKYMETDKYPTASFKGRIMDVKRINFTRPGSYKVRVQGDLTIHNVTKKVIVAGTLKVDKNIIGLQSKFSINIEDYKIDTGLGSVIIGDKMNIEVVANCQ